MATSPELRCLYNEVRNKGTFSLQMVRNAFSDATSEMSDKEVQIFGEFICRFLSFPSALHAVKQLERADRPPIVNHVRRPYAKPRRRAAKASA